jgi:hypothetical protein
MQSQRADARRSAEWRAACRFASVAWLNDRRTTVRGKGHEDVLPAARPAPQPRQRGVAGRAVGGCYLVGAPGQRQSGMILLASQVAGPTAVTVTTAAAMSRRRTRGRAAGAPSAQYRATMAVAPSTDTNGICRIGTWKVSGVPGRATTARPCRVHPVGQTVHRASEDDEGHRPAERVPGDARQRPHGARIRRSGQPG